jgi:protein-glutamine gamma-glutamyltransferase
MALLLRMSGIPARVVAGFSPGSFNRDSGEYRVRDLDAHSWVEVFFNGIGWVPFDPTPTQAPAESQSSGFGATSAAAGDAGEVRSREGVSPTSERAGGSDSGAGAGEGGGLPWWSLPIVALLAAGAFLGLRSLRARRGLAGEDMAAAQLAELRRARQARLLTAGGHHAARPRAQARPERGTGVGAVRGRAARPPLRSARARRPGPRRAARAAP